MDQPIPEITLNQIFQENQPSDHHSYPKRTYVVSKPGTIHLSIPSPLPKIDIPPPLPYLLAQMEEYIIVLFDRMQNLIAERITTSDLVAYAAKWDSLTAFVGSVL